MGVKIVTQLEHDQLTPSGLMVHDDHPADPIGKTTVAACVGSIFAQVRHDDRVVAIHAVTFTTPLTSSAPTADNEVEVASLPQVTVCGDAS